MIYIIDDFIDKTFYNLGLSYLNGTAFEKQVVGGKDFYTVDAPESFVSYVIQKLQQTEHRKLKPILAFFRESTDELDVSWRIHSDLKIKGEQPDRAIVLYMSPREKEELHGTALWEHQIYGRELPPDTSDEEYDRMISVDAENLDMWRLSSVVGYEPNRLVSYPSSYFHSKYPNVSWKDGRKIFVMFYKYEN